MPAFGGRTPRSVAGEQEQPVLGADAGQEPVEGVDGREEDEELDGVEEQRVSPPACRARTCPRRPVTLTDRAPC